MRFVPAIVALSCFGVVAASPPMNGKRTATLFNEIDEHTGHDNYAVFALTALTALVGSLALWASSDYQTCLNTAVVATSAIIGLVTSIEGIRKPQELWILERNTYYSLRDFEREVKYNGHNMTDTQLDQLFQEIQRLLSASKEKWGQYVAPANGTGTQPNSEPTDGQSAN